MTEIIRDEQKKNKRTIVVVTAALAALGLIVYYIYSSQKQYAPQPQKPKIELKGSADLDKESWQATEGKRVLELDKDVKELKDEVKKLSPKPPQGSGFSQFPLGTPPPPPAAGVPPPLGTPAAPAVQLPGLTPQPPSSALQPPKERPITGLIAIESGDVSAKPKDDKPATKESEKPQKAHISAGSYVKAVIINGVDAPTGTKGKGNPYPVLLRVIDLAQLPNKFRSDIRECFAIGEAYGELSSERAQIRVTTLSCMSNSGAQIEALVKGYVVGEDGKIGLAGRVVSKQGAVLARTMVAGFLSGFGSAVQQSAQTQTTSAVTGLPITTLDTDKVAQAALGNGLSKAADELAKFYLDLAKEMFPVVEVNSGRMVEIAFINRAQLAEVK